MVSAMTALGLTWDGYPKRKIASRPIYYRSRLTINAEAGNRLRKYLIVGSGSGAVFGAGMAAFSHANLLLGLVAGAVVGVACGVAYSTTQAGRRR